MPQGNNAPNARLADSNGQCKANGLGHVGPDSNGQCKANGLGHVQDVIQFASPVFYCDECEMAVQLEVIRMGMAQHTAAVRFETRDSSACAGEKYIAAKGELIFGPGEVQKSITIDLIQDQVFDSILEFEVHLFGVENAALGLYLFKCRVIVSDDDSFPTNKYANELNAGEVMELPQWSLLREYIRMNVADKRIRHAFFVAVALDQLVNLDAAWLLLLTNYLIDDLLRPGGHPPSYVHEHVAAIMVLAAVPHVFLWLANRAHIRLGLRGRSIFRLQGNLMRKFLNYTPHSSSIVTASDLTMAIARDVPELVDNGFMVCFPILQSIGLVIVMTIMALRQSYNIPVTLALVIAFPISMTVFVCLRDRLTERLERALFERQTDIVCYVQHVTEHQRIITDYFKRPAAVEAFNKTIEVCNKAKTNQALGNVTNASFAPLLSTLVVGVYILCNYRAVLEKDGMPVGEFVTGMAITKGIGQAFQTIYMGMLQLQQSMAPLHNVVLYMNLKCSDGERMKINRQLLRDAETARKAARDLLYGTPGEPCPMLSDKMTMMIGDHLEPIVYPSDLMQIWGKNVTFRYTGAGVGTMGPAILSHACFQIPQGKLIAVIGHHKSGKSTLLQILSGVLVPTDVDHLFMPPYLRVLHVSGEPRRLPQLSLYDDLCFGAGNEAGDKSRDRVFGICRRIGMHESHISRLQKTFHDLTALDMERTSSTMPGDDAADFMDHVLSGRTNRVTTQPVNETTAVNSYDSPVKVDMDGDADSGRLDKATMSTQSSESRRSGRNGDQEMLSHNDICAIHIARAVIMNPEVMIMHHPLSFFDHFQKKLVLDTLREFVDQRGVMKPDDMRSLRRPRTCIFSLQGTEDVVEYAKVADVVLHVSNGKVHVEDVHAVKKLKDTASELFRRMDTDGNCLISREEFVSIGRSNPHLYSVLKTVMPRLKRSHYNDAATGMGKVFDTMDTRGSGEVHVEGAIEFLHSRFHGNLDVLLDALQKVLTQDDNKALDNEELAVPEEETSLCMKTFSRELIMNESD